ncbi:MAG: hypothetical protein K2X87_33650 [Gemmataceae bacterium]|nr:hypothetical protein [Gemmataceae bacterium]
MTANSVTIRDHGKTVIDYEYDALGRPTGRFTETVVPPKPPKKYYAAPALRPDYPEEKLQSRVTGYAYSYRLPDLQVGDVVSMTCYRLKGEVVCDTICIHRRPGGVVPPEPGLSYRNISRPWHEWANAYQALEEKGTPLPFKFLSAEEQLERTAPPPREVGPPSVPLAKP